MYAKYISLAYMTNQTRKIITLSKENIRSLCWLANQDGRSVKNYIERIVDAHVKSYEGKIPKQSSKKIIK